MIEFLEATHFEVAVPHAFGAFHLSFLTVGITVTFLFAFILRNINEKHNNLLLFFIGAFLIILEIYKQLYFYFIIGKGHYIWDVFPFQPCSIPMYLCLSLPFIKNQSIKQTVYNYILIYGTLGGITVYLMPYTVFTENLSINIHSLVWHMILIFLGVYLYTSSRLKFSYDAYKNATKLFLLFCCIALIINISVYTLTDEFISLFFIGPQIKDIVLISEINKAHGWVSASVICVILMCLAGWIFYRIVCANGYNKKRRF